VSEHSWTIRGYAPGDEAKIVALFERVFGKPMGATESPRHWDWEFGQNPVGPRSIELVWDEDRLVGQYAVSPRRLWVEGRERLAALSLDTMTDPDYGRQGIFSASAAACYAAMAERGFDFVYGFPNANSVGGFERRLGWTMIMPAPVLVKPLDVGELVADKLGVPIAAPALGLPARWAAHTPRLLDVALQSVRARVGGGPRLEARDVPAFGDWADGLWERCRSQHRTWVIRDAAFLRWRYDARPESDYRRLQLLADGEVIGYAVLTFSNGNQGRVGFVMDLVADLRVPGAASALLRAIEARGRAERANFLSAMAGSSSPMLRTLLRHAYLPLPERLFPQELHFGARAFDPHNQGIYAPQAWHLTWGDIDVL
jgi:hypothetical protein